MTDKLDFIWTERAIDIKVKPLYVNKQNLNITFDQGFNFLINDNNQNKLKREILFQHINLIIIDLLLKEENNFKIYL